MGHLEGMTAAILPGTPAMGLGCRNHGIKPSLEYAGWIVDGRNYGEAPSGARWAANGIPVVIPVKIRLTAGFENQTSVERGPRRQVGRGMRGLSDGWISPLLRLSTFASKRDPGSKGL
jgi:hypothetical protein